MFSKNIKYLPFVLLFSLMASCMEVDVSVPSFPLMAKFFNTTEANIQLTLSLNFLGFCVASLCFGPLSDSFGRRRMMIVGFFLFCISSFGCSYANNLSLLLFCRLVQGMGASAVWVVAFAIVADSYKGDAAVKFIGIMNTVITAAMAIAPIIGAIICEKLGWRATYGFIAILSLLSFLACSGFLPETYKDLKPLKINSIVEDYLTLLKSYKFLIHSFAPSVLCAAYMAYVGTASFLYIDELNMSFRQYALHQSIVVSCFSITSFRLGTIQTKFGSRTTNILGVVLSILGILLIVPTTYTYNSSAYAVTIPMSIFATGVALSYGVIFAKSMELFPERRGAASALLMSFRVILCGLGVYASGVAYTGELFHTAIAIALIGIIGVICALLTLSYKEHVSETIEDSSST